MIYSFKNTCSVCSNDIEIPVLSDFTYGEFILQTNDGQYFCIAYLLDNPIYDFIVEYLQQSSESRDKFTEAQEILTLVADKYNGKGFTVDYPICPVCREPLESLGTEVRGEEMHLAEATWNRFEALKPLEKIQKIKEIILILNE